MPYPKNAIDLSPECKQASFDNHSQVRHALIIAAGRGSRFGKATHAMPKSLIPVGNVPIILRTILTARKAGITHFTVVTGYQAKILDQFLDRQMFSDLAVQSLYNEDWQRPNGLSVLRASGHLPESFLLLMSDHLFEEQILHTLLGTPLVAGHCRLAVDFHPENVLDLDDATKVQVTDGHIDNIGKAIKPYNGIDTGIFLCSQALFEALEASAAEGRESLSEGVLHLARQRRVEAANIGDLFWQDVDNERDLREGEKKLVKLLFSNEGNP